MSRKSDFTTFHRLNPEVYDRLVDKAKQLRANGITRIGIRMLWEALRWEAAISAFKQRSFSLPNNHAPFYARFIMAQNPELAGMFSVQSALAV